MQKRNTRGLQVTLTQKNGGEKKVGGGDSERLVRYSSFPANTRLLEKGCITRG